MELEKTNGYILIDTEIRVIKGFFDTKSSPPNILSSLFTRYLVPCNTHLKCSSSVYKLKYSKSKRGIIPLKIPYLYCWCHHGSIVWWLNWEITPFNKKILIHMFGVSMAVMKIEKLT